MIGLSELEKEVKAIILHSQEYPFDVNIHPLMLKWEKAKKKFIKAFGGTIWRSREPLVIHLSEEEKKIRFQNFLSEVDASGLNTEEFDTFLHDNYDGFFNNRVVCDYPKKSIRKGMKLLKSFKKFSCMEEVVRELQDMASRYIQEDKIEGYLYLSVDPRDFLTLSENNQNWTSCQSLDGDYRSGALSYMVDNTTVIAYIAGKDKEHFNCLPNGYNWYGKKWRMLIHTNLSSIVYYSRQYPFFNEGLLCEVDRSVKSTLLVNKMFTYPLHINNFEDLEFTEFNYFALKEVKYYSNDIILRSKYTGYSDLVFYKPGVKIFAAVNNKLYNKYCNSPTDNLFYKIFSIEIGGSVPCFVCRVNEVRRSNSFLCEKCIKEKHAEGDFYEFCQDCGKHLWSEDEIYIVDGEVYCEHCYCNEIFGSNEL